MFSLILIFIILFIPLPISIKFIFNNNAFSFYIYNKKIDYTRRVSKKAKHKIKSEDVITKLKRYINLAKKIRRHLKNCILKPIAFFTFNINYGFEDAFQTGIHYGTFNLIPTLIKENIDSYIKLFKFQFNIIPDFENKKFDFNSKCILWISLANTIFIAVVIFYEYLIQLQRLKHLGDDYYGNTSN